MASSHYEEINPLANHEKYEHQKWLNKGGFGFVALAKHRENGEDVAIKFLCRGPNINERVERELLNHRVLFHPHIIRFKHAFLTEKYLAIAMEYAPGGDLYEYIHSKQRGVEEKEARWIFQQLVLGLDYIHRKGISNRDIKPKNILLDDSPNPMVKICDFGFSKRDLKDSLPNTRLGTLPYMPPEIHFHSGHDKEIYDGKKADVWGCGALLYRMITNQYLIHSDMKDIEQFASHIEETLKKLDKPSSRHHMSEECKSMIRRLLVFDPEARPSIAEIMQDQWYTHGLPPGVASFNNHVEEQHPQTEEEIRQYFQKAREPID